MTCSTEQSSALLPRDDGRDRRASSLRPAVLLAAAACALGLVLVAWAHAGASAGELMGVQGSGQKMGAIMNSLNHKLAVHANVGDFVISGDLKADTQSLK